MPLNAALESHSFTERFRPERIAGLVTGGRVECVDTDHTPIGDRLACSDVVNESSPVLPRNRFDATLYQPYIRVL